MRHYIKAVSISSATIARLIGTIEVAGGAYGIVMGLLAIGRLALAGNISLAQDGMLFAATSALSVLAGIMLLRHSQLGRALSLFLQAVQIPVIVSPLLHFSVFYLFRLTIAWASDGQQLLGGIGGELFVRFGPGSRAFGATHVLGVNIVATTLFVILLRNGNAGQANRSQENTG